MQRNPSNDHHFSILPPNPNYVNLSDHSLINIDITTMLNNVPTSNFHFMTTSTPLYNDTWHSIQSPADAAGVAISGSGVLSSNSTTSDEGEEPNASLISERKQRRMISNRESARRSRMRKQRHLDELWSHVVWLRSENHHLVDRLNRAAERHESVVRENSQLKEEASELRQMLSDLRIHSPAMQTTPFHFDEDVTPCNAAYLRAESSNQPNSITASMDLLG